MSETATATFAAGCFWGVQAEFDAMPGVLGTEVGYIGGTQPEPTYADVCGHNTGHAEAVRITFDPERVSFDELTRAFFRLHDPTQIDRQGPDIGDQYRSAIFPSDVEQAEAAARLIREEDGSGRHRRPLATKIEPVTTWWPAEDYHQKYFEKRGIKH